MNTNDFNDTIYNLDILIYNLAFTFLKQFYCCNNLIHYHYILLFLTLWQEQSISCITYYLIISLFDNLLFYHAVFIHVTTFFVDKGLREEITSSVGVIA